MAVELHLRCIDKVHAAIVAMALPSLPAGQVYQKKLPTAGDITLPAIVVSYPPDEGERIEAGGVHNRTSIGWPVCVTFLAADNQDMALGADAEMLAEWRRRVLLHFHDQHLTGVTEVNFCRVEPRATIDMEYFRGNLHAGALVIVCWTRLSPV